METESRGVVLLDALPGDDRDFDRSLFERWEHPVRQCAGPEVKTLCPLLGGHNCPLYAEAHGIVFKRDLDRPQHRAIVRRYREFACADLPIRVLCSPDQARRYRALLADVEVWDHEPTTADLDGFAAHVESVDRFA